MAAEKRRIGGVTLQQRHRDGRTHWRITWTDENGRQRERTARTASDAETIAAEVAVALRTPGSALNPSVTFRALTAAYLAPDQHAGWRSPATEAKATSIARTHLVPAFGDRKCSTLTAADFNRLLERLAEQGYSQQTLRTVLEVLRAVVGWGQRMGVWDAWAQPVREVGMPKGHRAHQTVELIDRAQVPTAAQVEDLAVALRTVVPAGDLLARLAAGSGLRFGELAGLQPGDIDLDGRRITVARQLREVRGHLEPDALPKHEKTRTTIVPQELVEPLAAHLDGLQPDQPLFVGARGGRLRRSSFGRAFREAREASSYPNHLTLHSLRHYFCCSLIDRGVRPGTVSKLAGHHSVRFTLERYLGAADDYLDEALQAT